MEQFLIFVLLVGGGIAWLVNSSKEKEEKRRAEAAFTAKMTEFRRALAAGENPAREIRNLVEQVEVDDPNDLQSAIQKKLDETVRNTYYDATPNVNVVGPSKAIIHFHGEFPPDA